MITIKPDDSDVEKILRDNGPGIVYEFEPGFYDAVLFRESFIASENKPTVLRSTIKGGAIVLPSEPYLCGIYSDDRMQQANLVIEGFTVRRASVDGIRFIHSRGIVVRDCLVEGCDGMGVALHDSEDCLVEDSSMRFCGLRTGGHGLYASGLNLEVRHSFFIGNGGWGCHLWPGVINAKITDCEAYANSGSGFVIGRLTRTAEDANLVARCVASGNSTGIQLSSGAYDRIVECTAIANEYSINLQRSAVAPVFIEGCTLDKEVHNPGLMARINDTVILKTKEQNDG